MGIVLRHGPQCCLKEYAYYTEDFEKQEAVLKDYYDGNSAIGMVE